MSTLIEQLQPHNLPHTPDGSFIITDKQRESVLSMLSQIADLQRWKAEAIAVMPDYHAIGKALKVPLGQSIHDKILPAIQQLQQQQTVVVEQTDEELQICESCDSIFDIEIMHSDAESNWFCPTCWKELAPVMQAEALSQNDEEDIYDAVAQYRKDHPEQLSKEQGMRWVKAGIMPDYDGEYFGEVLKTEVCGTKNKYKRVVYCRMNKWELFYDEELIYWLDESADLTTPKTNHQ